MNDLLDRRLTHLARRRILARIIAGVLPTVALTASVAACLVVLLRLALPHMAWLAWPLAAIGLLAPLVRVPGLLSHHDQPSVLAGHLDRLVDGRGVVMALAAQPVTQRDPDWLEYVRYRLENIVWPALAWPTWQLAVLAVGAVITAALLPQRVPPTEVRDAWQALIDDGRQRLAAVADAGLMDKPTQQLLEQQIARLAETAAQQGMSESVWQGLDRIERLAGDRAQAAVRRLAEVLVQAERSGDQNVSLAESQAELQQLARQLAELQRQAPGLVPSQLPANLAEALQSAQAAQVLTPEQLAALQAMGLNMQQRPGVAGDPTGEAGRAAAADLARQLAKRGQLLDKLGLHQQFALALAACQQPGRGGVRRGPGHAVLELNNAGLEQAEAGQNLPPGARLNADGSVTLAEVQREADIDQQAFAGVVVQNLFKRVSSDLDRNR